VADTAFRVTGRVQGVGYRWWARSQATGLGLVGTVRNADDGSVEVQARGSDHALLELERLLGEGPPHARVAAVEPIPAAVPAGAASFEVVR